MKVIKYFFNTIERLYDKKVNSSGLAIFRVVWGLVLLLEIFQLFTYRDLRFDTIPFIKGFEITLGPIILVWFFCVLFIIFGFKTKLNTLLNYFFSILFFGSLYTQEYQVFKIYIAVSFILMFIPISNSYSIDNLIIKIKYTKNNYLHKTKNKVSVIYYYILILIGFGFFFFDSSLHKLGSESWINGYGVLDPLLLPNFRVNESTFLVKNIFLLKLINYSILIFEFLFVFIFFIKKLRWTIVFIGICIQFGVLFYSPTPLFSLALSSLFILIIPLNTWAKIKLFLKSKQTKITFIYDGNCPLCTKTRVLIENVDFFNRIDFITAQDAKNHFKALKDIDQTELITHIYSVSKKGNIYKGVDTYIQVLFHTIIFSPIALIMSLPGIKHLGKFIYSYFAKNREREICDENHCIIYSAPQEIDQNKSIIKGISLKKIKTMKLSFFIITLVVLQLNASISSGSIGNTLNNTGFWKTNIGHFIEPIHKNILVLTQQFLGVTNHPVITDELNNYNNIFALTYLNEQGKEIWLPIIDKNGNPGKYNYGANWANWTFRVNGVFYSKQQLTKGVIRYTSFWAIKSGKNLNHLSLKIKLKKVKLATNPLLLNKNDWIDFGEINWKNRKANVKMFYDLVEKNTNLFMKIEKP